MRVLHPNHQKTWLESLLQAEERQGSGALIRAGQPVEEIYILREGEVKVKKGDEEIATLKRGDFIGALNKVQRGEPADYSFVHDLFEAFGRNRPLVGRPLDPLADLVAVVGHARAVALDDRQTNGLFDPLVGGEPASAVQALAAPADAGATLTGS